MELKIFNSKLEFLSIIDNFTSFRWVRKYQGVGEFELHVPYTEENVKILTYENIIYKGSNEAGYIERIEYALDEKGEETIKVMGKDITGYLSRRINYQKVIFKGTSEVLMRTLVVDNCIFPVEEQRIIPNLKVRERTGIEDVVEYQNSYGNIQTLCEEISASNDVGFKIYFDMPNRELIFEAYKGEDRTVLQSVNPATVFSRDLENIVSQTYFNGIDNFKNFALIGGAGEDTERRKTTIGNAKGIERFETFVDARDLSDKKSVVSENEAGEEVTTEVTMEDVEYIPILQERGKEKLAEFKLTQTLESSINVNSNLLYKRDYDLGDKVTVLDKKWGLLLNVVITEITESYERDGMSIDVNFGNNVPTLIDKIKAEIKR